MILFIFIAIVIAAAILSSLSMLVLKIIRKPKSWRSLFFISLICLLALYLGAAGIFTITPSSTKCEKTQTGSVCNTELTSGFQPYLDLRLIGKEIGCRISGKIYRDRLLSLSGKIESYCDRPFDDAGKKCTDSSQCEGLCIVSISDYIPFSEDCTKYTCVGECSKIMPQTCLFDQDKFHLKDGKIQNALTGCTLDENGEEICYSEALCD